LRYAVDMLAVGSFTEDEIWTFGEVIGALAEAIEIESRARLSERLAVMERAPANAIKRLAFDDAISVAGPVLRNSGQLSTQTLIENIRTKSQQHLLAISQRKSLAPEVTNELVRHGNRDVLTSVASNGGARFSRSGFLQLIQRAENDSILINHVGNRRDIPRELFQQLISKASAEVRSKLESERPDMSALVQDSVAGVTDNLHATFGPASKTYFEAKRTIATRKRYGELEEMSIRKDALDHKIDEVLVGLSHLCDLPVHAVERVLRDSEMTMIVAKARDFEWDTTMALLFLRAKDHRINASRFDGMKEDYSRLDARTCNDVMDTYRANRRTGGNTT
jgi:uncharacterized protein (DUF2336 family)